MKYLLLALISLFYLSSYSDHKKDPMSEEEKARYHELDKKNPLTDKEQEEYITLMKKYFKVNLKLDDHFNEYMFFEYIISKIEKTKTTTYYSAYTHLKPDLIEIGKTPLCTKERLEKKSCPKAPYMIIYLAKKHLESGDCVDSSYILGDLLERYVIPRTDMGNSEEFFHTLSYIAFYFTYKVTQHETSFFYEELRKKQEAYGKKSELTDLLNEDLKEKKKEMKERLKWSYNQVIKLRKRLNKKSQITADKMIHELIEKWSKKYGADQIYKCRKENDDLSFYTNESKIKFLEEYYPYLLD